MNQLEDFAHQRNLTGIAAQAMLAKAKLRLKQGRMEEAADLLEEVEEIAEDPTMRFLEDKVEELKRYASSS
jgi:predicted acyltransferase (DUF342 family)